MSGIPVRSNRRERLTEVLPTGTRIFSRGFLPSLAMTNQALGLSRGVALATLVSSSLVIAQEGGSEVIKEQQPERIVTEQKPRELLNRILVRKGWGLGYNSELGRFIAIGQAPILADPGTPGWPSARSQAFTEAMLDAKRTLAEFMRVEISRSTGVTDNESDPTEAFEKARERLSKPDIDPRSLSMVDKVAYAAHQEMNSYLESRGFAGGEAPKEDVKKAIEAVVLRAEFSDRIDTATHAEIAGMAAYQTIEAANHIGVIGILTEDSTHQMAAAVLGRASVERRDAASQTLTEWLSELESAGSLPFTHGVRLKTDENGDLNLVAIVHATPMHASARGAGNTSKVAVNAAQGEIRSFVGEALQASSALVRASTYDEIEDLAGNLRTQYASRESFKTKTQAVANALTLSGSNPVYTAEYRHPDMLANGDERVSIVMAYAWNVRSRDAARELSAIVESLGGSLGDASVIVEKPESESPQGASGAARKPKPTSGKGIGAQGDDPDFGGAGRRRGGERRTGSGGPGSGAGGGEAGRSGGSRQKPPLPPRSGAGGGGL